MNKLDIHVFDDRIMNRPISSYDRNVHKQLSQLKNLHIFKGEDGNLMICFSGSSALEIIPGSFLNGLWRNFDNKGGVEVDNVYYHTDSSLPKNSQIDRWLEVLIGQIGIHQMNHVFVGVTIIDNFRPASRLPDFSSPQFVHDINTRRVDQSMDPIEAALRGLDHFSSSSDSTDTGPFDDISWNGERRRDDIRDDDDDSSGYYGILDCIDQPKSEKKWNKHGILVADSNTIKHDAEIIREVLKEIAPGDEPWLVKFRAIMEERWIDCMVVKPSKLEKMEAEARSGRFFDGARTALSITGSAVGLYGVGRSLIGKGKL